MTEKLARLRNEPRPLRFLASRLLWRSRLCSLCTIQCSPYRLRFYPTAYSATLWLDSAARLQDEQLLYNVLRPGDTVVDVGANIGTVTLAAAAIVGPSGRVYSVEAHPRTYKYLQGNLRLNRVCNVRSFNVACGRRTGTVTFSNKHSDDQNSVAESGLRVPLRRLDDLVSSTEARRVALLKVDVEGYEKFVFEGATELLPRVDALYFESWERHYDTFDYKLSEVTKLLRQFGFETRRCNGDEVTDDYNSVSCENLLARRKLPISSAKPSSRPLNV